MEIFLFLSSIVTFIIGVFSILLSKNVLHQMMGGITLIIATLLFVGAAMYSKLSEIRELLHRNLK